MYSDAVPASRTILSLPDPGIRLVGLEGAGPVGGGEGDAHWEEVQSHQLEESRGWGGDCESYLWSWGIFVVGLLLVGGAGSPTTTEFVKTNIEEEEEEDADEEEGKKKKPRNVYGFSMENRIQDACGISVEDTYVITGNLWHWH